MGEADPPPVFGPWTPAVVEAPVTDLETNPEPWQPVVIR